MDSCAWIPYSSALGNSDTSPVIQKKRGLLRAAKGQKTEWAVGQRTVDTAAVDSCAWILYSSAFKNSDTSPVIRKKRGLLRAANRQTTGWAGRWRSGHSCAAQGNEEWRLEEEVGGGGDGVRGEGGRWGGGKRGASERTGQQEVQQQASVPILSLNHTRSQ